MQEIKTTIKSDSGEWKTAIFEVGNTYQLSASLGAKDIHMMITKRSYLDYLKKKQDKEEVSPNFGLSCTGREHLSQVEFEMMRKELYTNMDADLSEEKFEAGIIPPN